MRARATIVVLLCTTVAACKGKSDASTAPDPGAIKLQKELLAKREALAEQRQEEQNQLEVLDSQIKDIESKGGSAAEQKQKKAELESRLAQSGSAFSELTSKLDAIQAQGDQSAALAARMERVAQAEADVAKREAEVSKRLDELERLMKELDGKCGNAGPALVIQQGPAGGAHSRRDVDPLLQQARKDMARRGILAADLPTSAQGLEGEATSAMAKNDWGTAYLAAAQLAAQVGAIKIDRAFVMAKYNRLNARVTGAALSPDVSQKLTDGMKDVLQKFGDGDFAAANHKLNALNALVR